MKTYHRQRVLFYNCLVTVFGLFFLADANAWFLVKLTYPFWIAIVCIVIGLASIMYKEDSLV